MKAGDIIFVKGDSWISKVITWFDKGDFSHVAIAVSEDTVIEAQRFSKVRRVKHGYVDYTVVDLSLTAEEQAKLMFTANAMIGMRYDYGQIFSMMMSKLLGNRWNRRRMNDPRKLICSELVSTSLYMADIVPKHDYLYDLSPNELYAMVTSLRQQREAEQKKLYTQY